MDNKNMQPTVSVCMITYNHEAYIAEAIEGVLMQKTTFPIKLIIGEDGSTDNTRSICSQYQEKYPEIIELLPFEGNLGMTPNFIKTLKACTGKYLALCEGDDYWTNPNKLQKQVNILESDNSLAGCFHNSTKVNAEGKVISKEYFKGGHKREYNQLECITELKSSYSTASLIFTSYDLFPTPSDANAIMCDLVLDFLLTRKKKLFYLDENMSAYRIHEGGVWQGEKDISKLDKELLRRHLLLYKSNEIINPENKDAIKIEIAKNLQRLLNFNHIDIKEKLKFAFMYIKYATQYSLLTRVKFALPRII